MNIRESFALESFFKAADLFIDCIRTNKSIYIAITILFCLFFMGAISCIVIYYKNKQNSNIRLKMLSYGIIFLTCFCLFMINLLFTWQIAIPVSLIAVLLINKEKKICCDLEIKKQLSENILNDKNVVFNPIYINFYFLIIISTIISIVCHISIHYLGVD